MQIAKKPRAIGNELIGGEVDAWLAQHIAVGIQTIHTHGLIGLVAKGGLKGGAKVFKCGGLSAKIGLRRHL